MNEPVTILMNALRSMVELHVAEDGASRERVAELVNEAIQCAALADMVNTHREKGGCTVDCPSVGCTIFGALAIADETVQSVIECNLVAVTIGDTVWYDSGRRDSLAAAAIEEALLYADQRGLLRRLPSAPSLVRVVLIEPAYEVLA